MTFDSLKEVIKTIKKIKPKDVKLRFVDGFDDKYINGLFYITESGVRVCAIKKTMPYIVIAHTLLHEVCHSLTFKDEWMEPSKTFYLCEYVAEKKLRKICRDNNWLNILKLSDGWIIKILKSKKLKENDPSNYIYMAKRIAREEGIK